jgi:FAD synthase
VPEKLRLLEATGIDAVLMLPFGRDLSLMTPRQFAERILEERNCMRARCMKATTSALGTRLRAT